MDKDFVKYLPWWIFVVFMIFVACYFFIIPFISMILFKLGYMKYSAYHDRQRGLHPNIRFQRRIFYLLQIIKRKLYFRILVKNGQFETKIINNKKLFHTQCLITGENRWVEEEWIYEALHFKIISNAKLHKRQIVITKDAYNKEIPEYNDKVGDISYFVLAIGAYYDMSNVTMDLDAVKSNFYK